MTSALLQGNLRATGSFLSTRPARPGAALAALTETGSIPLYGLKRFWSKTQGARVEPSPIEERRDRIVLSIAGMGLEEAIVYLYREQPSFDAFERWILSSAGTALDRAAMARFNAVAVESAVGADIALQDGDGAAATPLDDELLDHFGANGFVVLPGAISPDDARASAALLWATIGADPGDPASWDRPHLLRQNIMVQRFRGEPFERNRRSPRIRGAFEQLYGRRDIWPIVDRLGFNPPTAAERVAQPARLHWDVALGPPVPFLLQGLIYLNDVAAGQGAFSCVPGFQHRLDAWLRTLPPGSDPHMQDLDALGRVYVPGNAGDMVIWHQALPHGASRNTSRMPRLVQYFTYLPLAPA
jgi:hypothetical protein